MTADEVLTYLDALDLPRHEPQALLAGAAGICCLDGDAPRHFTRRAPEFIDDPDDTGLFVGLGAAPVTYPPNFLVSVRDALLTGYRTLVTPDGHFLHDDSLRGPLLRRYLDAMRQPDDFPNEDTRLRPIDASDRFRLDRDGRPEQRLDGRVALLCSTEPSNYGSFLFRVLPKLVALRRHGLDRDRVLVHLPAPAFADLLGLCGLAPDRLVPHDTRRLYRIEHAILPGLRNNQAFLDPETLDLYAALRARHGGPSTGRRLYVSRAGQARRRASGRVMMNEAALIEALAARGFDIIEPEALAPAAQIAAFASAGLVVGPSGSAMFNAVFCHPGTRLIDIESEPHWIHAHACLFTSCGLRYGIFVGAVDQADPAPVHRRWTVNIPALLRRIDAFG